MTEFQNVVGLFGTSGHSKWRDQVIDRLEQENIPYFNPLVKAGWTPEMAVREAKHLATDKVILFVITNETQSFGALAESGWAARSATQNGQQAIFMIEEFDGDKNSAAGRARILVQSHAQTAGVPLFSELEPAIDEVIRSFHAAA